MISQALGIVGSGWCRARTLTFPRMSSESKIPCEKGLFAAGTSMLSNCVFAPVGPLVNSDLSLHWAFLRLVCRVVVRVTVSVLYRSRWAEIGC
ncbi:hypothetical protein CRG98_023040 [Punica granatum]|uniref:Uncharacterized protein n=1 Tax=Punica granatum TaxID=22663 RepID=A0A2I0JJW5_PUNGR|nr:hypothetical protein CRG98_023040 [Punica granatum]